MVLVLVREYFEDGTNGTIFWGDKKICHTIELPWRGNQRRASCIPEGEYVLKKRYSPRHKWHLAVEGVNGRNSILIHPANNAKLELLGCVAPVTKLSGAGTGLLSRQAFTQLREFVYGAIAKNEKVSIIIKS